MNWIFHPKFFTLYQKGELRKNFSSDILAGIVVGIVALPLAIAFAVASGVSPEKGLITAIIAGFIISFLGGSRVQIGGPTGAFIVIVYGILQQYGYNGLVIATILSGIMLIVFGLLRLGSLLKYFPHSLIVGFTSGIALVILSTQIKDALGLELTHVPSEFIDKWSVYVQHLSATNLYALGITITTILLTVYAKKITTRIPGSFIAIIGMTILVQVTGIHVTTIETFFHEIPKDIHFSFPTISFHELGYYLKPALTIALLGGIESLLSAVVADGMTGGNHRSNTELMAQGVANIVTPLFGGIPATGAIARTATNIKNGGKTPIAGMVHALTLLFIMLFFGQWAKLIPMSCLAGILIVVAYNMSEWRSFYSILKGSAFDIIILLTTFLLTVLVDLTVAIEIGVVLAALLFMRRMSDLREKKIYTMDSDIAEDYSSISKGIAIYEISGPLFFATAKQYCELIKETGLEAKVLIIRMRHVPFVDATGIHNLKELVKMLHQQHIKIILSGLNPEVRKELDKARISFLIGKANLFTSFKEALERAEEINT